MHQRGTWSGDPEAAAKSVRRRLCQGAPASPSRERKSVVYGKRRQLIGADDLVRQPQVARFGSRLLRCCSRAGAQATARSLRSLQPFAPKPQPLAGLCSITADVCVGLHAARTSGVRRFRTCDRRPARARWALLPPTSQSWLGETQALDGATQLMCIHARVALCGVQVLVSEQLLDLAQVRACAQELGREHVAQGVGRDALCLSMPAAWA